MKLRLSKIYLLSLVLLVSLTFTYADPQAICCYNPTNSNSITPGIDSCSEGSYNVGSFDSNTQCNSYEDKKKGCQKNGQCYETAFGSYIYDISEVTNYFQSEHGIDIGTYCNLVDFTSDCGGDITSTSGIIIDNNSTDIGIETGGDSQIGDAIDPEDAQTDEYIAQKLEDIKFCADVGFPFGIFFSESDCNNLEDEQGNKPCLYNPYYGGKMKISSSQNDFGIFPMEVGCVPKLEINSCYDYKTKANCQENPLYHDENYNRSNLRNCTWVDTQDFFSDFNKGQDSGICIATYINEDKHFNIEHYTSRQNLIVNGSFEDNTGSTGHSFHGTKNYPINVDETFTTTINHLAKGVGYNIVFYLMQDSSFGNNTLELTLVQKDSSGAHLKTDTHLVNLNEYTTPNGIYKKVTFPQLVTENNIETINMSIEAEQDIVIDGLSFEKYIDTQPLADTGVFKPVTIIDNNASNCEECFSDKDMNFCTQGKSDLLGDCSYMVNNYYSGYNSSLEDYLGKDENPYYNDWNSQSLANSKVFCELYLTQEKCEDPNNYLNKNFGQLHELVSESSDRTLCQWSGTYGCFKDSSASNGPDTKNSGDVHLYRHDLNKNGWSHSLFNSYQFQTTDGNLSDFVFGCDMIPPQSYIYFTAKNASGDNIIIRDDDFPSEIIGAVTMHLSAYDIWQEACDPFDLTKQIYFDYKIDSDAHYRVASSYMLEESYPIEDYFVDSTATSLMSEGYNDITLSIKDQSGNIEKIINYDNINIDLEGPVIEIIFPSTEPNGLIGSQTLGPNQNLTIEVTDYSQINSCTYGLTPTGSQNIPSSYFNASGNLSTFSTVYSDDDDYKRYDFQLPIYNTSVLGDSYILSLTCNDIFDQTTTNNYILSVDYQTEFVLIEPLGFMSYDVNLGFMNSQKDVHIVSSEELDSCTITSSDDLNSPEDLTIDTSQTFDFQTYTDLQSNITGTLDFDSDGIKEIIITCEDTNFNTVTANLTYYYDTQSPILNSFNMIDIGQKSVVEYEDNYYIKSSNIINDKLNISINGTGSWMSNSNLSIEYQNSTDTFYEITGATFTNFDINETTYLAQSEISSFINPIIYIGEDTGDNINLYRQTYRINFSDKAGNIGSETINLYYDNSNPRFNFENPPIHRNENNLYTSFANPNMIIDFNSHEYRKYNCTIQGDWQGKLYSNTYNEVSDLNFNFDDFIPEFDLENVDSFDFSLSCVDIFGESLDGDFNLKYDVTPPQIDNIALNNGDTYLYNGGINMDYFANNNPKSLLDNLIFEMVNTNEERYFCNYTLSSSDYICNSDQYLEEFTTIYHESENIPILSKDESDGGICYMGNQFLNNLHTAKTNQQILNTQINFEISCIDAVNLETDPQTFTIPLNIRYYTQNDFSTFTVDYETSTALFTAESFNLFDKVAIYLDNSGNNNKHITDLVATMNADGTYTYTGNIDISELDETLTQVWVIGFDGADNIVATKSSSIVVDQTNPTVTLNVPDADLDNKVYSTDFAVEFFAQDLGGSTLGNIEFYINNHKVYSSDNLSQYDDTKINFDEIANYYSNYNNNYQGDLIITNTTVGETYELKVIAYDKIGNMNQTIMNVEVVDDLMIILLDSINAFASQSKTSWITNHDNPSIKFKTSKQVEECRLYPFVDEEWETILNDENIALEEQTILGTSVTDNIFEFDLSSFEGYNASSLSHNDASLLIKCKYNASAYYDFTRKLHNLDKLPDYTLTSSEGFILNENPFRTDITIKAVSHYKFMNCRYTIDGTNEQDFNGLYDEEFVQILDFSTYSDGQHSLELVCQNKLGIEGPTKTYDFYVNKNAVTQIENIKLFKSNKELNLNMDEDMYVNDNGYGLVFELNKKNVNCNIEIDSSQGFFNTIINFFKNLFVDNNMEITDDLKPYQYKLSEGEINFDQDILNRLTISCDGFNDDIEIDIYHLSESNFDIDLTIN
ncbi:MAG: hypothetical protein ACOC16_03500 [Nanoarchaeota archaeon]